MREGGREGGRDGGRGGGLSERGGEGVEGERPVGGSGCAGSERRCVPRAILARINCIRQLEPSAENLAVETMPNWFSLT